MEYARGLHRRPDHQATAEIRGCLDRGATVQIDFTEARLSLRLDRSGGLLAAFVDLNNQVLGGDRAGTCRVGVHTCPGGDKDSTHSADIDYADLMPELFGLNLDTSTSSSRARRTKKTGHWDRRAARRRAGGPSSA